MRIISDTKDYYDSVQSVAQDREIVYVRKEIKEEIDWLFPLLLCHRDYPLAPISINIIGFCGSIYPCLQVSATKQAGYERSFCYYPNDVCQFARANLDFRDQEVFDTGNRRFGRAVSSGYVSRYIVSDFFEVCERRKNDFQDWFKKGPIFHASIGFYHRTGTIVYNARLRDIDFMRIKDPFTAFQEIRMWLSNQASPEKPVPEIPDEVLLEAKGFNEYSFRKPKKSSL